LRSPDFDTEKRQINRNANQQKSQPRILLCLSNKFSDSGRRCFGRMALVKNKAPFGLVDGNLIEEIEKGKYQEFVDVSHYAIHFGSSQPVVMFEYNHEGPRLYDFEFYIRRIARDAKIAKSVNFTIHLDVEIKDLDSSIYNVFSVSVKVNSNTANRVNWLAPLKKMSQETGYKDVKLDLVFQKQKDLLGRYIRNLRGLDYAKDILGWINKDKNNIGRLEALKMSYQLKGQDQIYDLDFIKNKTTSVLDVPFIDGKLYAPDGLNTIIGQELNVFIDTGKPTPLAD